MIKSYDEKIERLKESIRQDENQLKQLIQKQKEQDKKARTHRLVERGAILESLIDDAEMLTNEQIKTLLERTVGSSYGVKIIDSVRGQVSVVSAQGAEVTKEDS